MEIKEDLLTLFTLQDVQQKPNNQHAKHAAAMGNNTGNFQAPAYKGSKKASLAPNGTRHGMATSPPRRVHTSNPNVHGGGDGIGSSSGQQTS